MIQDLIHKKIVNNIDEVTAWFQSKREGLEVPFYASFDIRDSGEKIAPVDANIFPAGFNNICQQDQESSVELAQKYLKMFYPEAKYVGLVTEEHTKNAYYWENVSMIAQIIEHAGFEVAITFPRDLDGPIEVESVSGKKLMVQPSKRSEGTFLIGDSPIDLIISNNDFSQNIDSWLEGLETPINPPYDLGWHVRKKAQFFAQYNELAAEFAKVIEIDPNVLLIKTETFSGFDIGDETSRDQLATRTDSFLEELQGYYKDSGFSTEPFAFIKNNSGTYGMGILNVSSGADVRAWNYKSKKTMKAVKGGGSINEVVIQEGIPTRMQEDGVSAEPVIYMLGCGLAGGFLRTHSKKGPEGNLNSPGAIYKKLCVSDLSVDIQGRPMENVYGWLAKLGVIAISREAKNRGIKII